MADQWYVGRNGQKAGPYSTEQLKQMAAAGKLVPSDLLWKQGLEAWVPLSKVKGLMPAAGGSTLPPLDLATPGSGQPGGDFDFLDGQAAASRDGGSPDWNPYQASTAAAAGPAAASGIVYAEFFPRVGAYLLDAIFVGVIGMILQFGLAIVFGAVSGGDNGMIAVGSLLGSLLSFLVAIAYFVGYETSAKQGTWGKQLVGIKVTDMDGRPITTGRAVGRFFAKIISNLTCGIGYLLPLFTDKKQTLHDLICGCLALKK
jgi:uncharacterized RDD family membrane protein YckC